MKTIIPNYYNKFNCIANKCHHNCCIGWEIDIDEETLDIYKSHKGKFSRTLKNGIDHKEDYASFKLDGKGRCVFLNSDNLCDIILNLGEKSLCQVCSDHPRFRNFYETATEVGLGLCCEEAGRIILGQTEKLKFSVDNQDNETDNEEEKLFLEYKQSLLNTLQNDKYTLSERINLLLDESDIETERIDFNKWVDFYLSLERLDDKWTNLLSDIKTIDFEDIILSEKYNKAFEKLLLYFIYRHFDSADNGKLHFAIFSTYFIGQICRYHVRKYGSLAFEDFVEYARQYSSEIEYSDENIEKITEKL